MKWKKLSSHLILNHSRLIVAEDEVLLPSGQQTSYLLFVEKNQSALVICKDIQDRILLQKEYSYPVNDTLFQFPGGSGKDGEAPIDIAIRELQEESGIRAKKLELIGKYYPNNRRSSSFMHVFLATEIDNVSTCPDDEEEIENIWMSEENINSLISEGKITNVHVLGAWMLYQNHKDRSK